MFGDVYNGKRVLVTGHSGFKGSWLAMWLRRLGAEVCGIALPPETEVSHYNLLKPELRSEWCDLRDAEHVAGIVRDFRPEIVFHLAAQPLVRKSYAEPALTFAVNVGGMVNLLEALRSTGGTRAIVIVTSDKCYRNDESPRGHREEDPLGGYDPYSASKACQELLAASYRDSFFARGGTLLATARAGNVIGGGDWAADRLIPDLVRAAARGECEPLRSPDAVRPWQHVLEPLGGYLLLGQRLFEGETQVATGWNFGPAENDALTVGEVAAQMKRFWPRVEFRFAPQPDAPHETKLLQLNCAKAERELHWHGVWSAGEAIRRTAEWYRDFYETGAVDTAADLDGYLAAAAERGVVWMR